MPSGSHGGSAGSHGGFSGGGGGFSGGGSSFHGSSHRGFRPRGPRFIHFGHRVVILTSPRQTLIGILAVFIFFVGSLLFAFSSQLSYAKEELKLIEEENAYYLQMVQNAKDNPEYVVEGKVTDQFYYEKFERYYITYSFKSADGQRVEGYTFSIYTLENLPKKGSTIRLAVNDNPTNSSTDSIPMDYENYTLNDDGEYLFQLENKKSATKSLWITGIIVALLIGGVILTIATAKRKENEEEETSGESFNSSSSSTEAKPETCDYCGARISSTDKVCPQCGARLL